MADYYFTTIWRIKAPVEAVWEELVHPERWPSWWKGVERVEIVEKGEANGLGSVGRFTWKSKLPYRLVFNLKLVGFEPLARLEADASGELAGKGIWQLTREGDETVARYDWSVKTTKAWMELLAPVGRPFFEWNHDLIMAWGAEGLRKRLGTTVVEQ